MIRSYVITSLKFTIDILIDMTSVNQSSKSVSYIIVNRTDFWQRKQIRKLTLLFKNSRVQKLVSSLSCLYYWATNLLCWILNYLTSSYLYHVIQYSLQSSDNELYSSNLSTLRENNLLKMTSENEQMWNEMTIWCCRYLYNLSDSSDYVCESLKSFLCCKWCRNDWKLCFLIFSFFFSF